MAFQDRLDGLNSARDPLPIADGYIDSAAGDPSSVGIDPGLRLYPWAGQAAQLDAVRRTASALSLTSSEDSMARSKAVRTKFEHANPILRVANVQRSLRYYVNALGFSNAEWGSDNFTCVTRDGANIYLSEGDQGHPGTWVWLGVDDVEALYDEYKDSGAQILQLPENFPWACEMKVADPDGHVLRFGSDPKKEA